MHPTDINNEHAEGGTESTVPPLSATPPTETIASDAQNMLNVALRYISYLNPLVEPTLPLAMSFFTLFTFSVTKFFTMEKKQ